MAVWYQKAVLLRPKHRTGLSIIQGHGKPKFLLHTTESVNYNPSTSGYYGHQYWPHATGPLSRTGQVWQHFPVGVGAYALRAGRGGQTNRTPTFQLEIPWRAVEAALMPMHMLDEIRRMIIWYAGETGMPWRHLSFVSYPQSYGQKAAQRLAMSDWLNYAGVVGHQHAPITNDHGDPGAINIRYIMREREEDVSPRDWLKFAQGSGPVVWLLNLTNMTKEGMESWDAINGIAKMFGLDPTIHRVHQDVIRQFEGD